jgi:hypothetical protein
VRAFRPWFIVSGAAIAFAAAALACVGDDPAIADVGASDGGGDTATTEPGADGAPDTGPPSDGGADSATEPDADIGPCNGTTHCARYVFHTSAPYTGGTLLGYAQADARCKESADGAQASPVLAGRTWHAWLSTSAPDGGAVAQRLVHGTGPYRLIDGTVIANNWTDLVDGNIDATISMDEKGAVVSNDNSAWTGTLKNGTASTFTCDNWTNPSGSLFGQVGSVGATDQQWTQKADTLSCAGSAGLICIED